MRVRERLSPHSKAAVVSIDKVLSKNEAGDTLFNFALYLASIIILEEAQ